MWVATPSPRLDDAHHSTLEWTLDINPLCLTAFGVLAGSGRCLVKHPHVANQLHSESVSIPKNPRTERPVGYAFVDLSTPTEADRAIAELSGKEILERKVSVQLARKPETTEKTENNGEGAGAEGTRRRQSTRGRGRAGRGRGGRARGGRGSGVSGVPEPNGCNWSLTCLAG